MGLQRYRHRREFARAPEPRGEPPARPAKARHGALRFVVQKHSESSPHFDLRLEIDGVQKGWAVPRDPGDESSAKRLAVHTEDRPLEPAGFEGDVAAGEYGDGPTHIWDRGTWIPEGSPVASFRRGNLQFELKGKRMKGHWALLRVGNASTRKKDLWVLVRRPEGVPRP